MNSNNIFIHINGIKILYFADKERK